MTEKRHERGRRAPVVPGQWNTVFLYALALLILCGSLAAQNLTIVPAIGSVVMSDSADAKNVEYQLKAAFLYNFMKFIEWPPGAGGKDAQKKDPITLCVIGTDFFGKHLDDLTKKEVKERVIRIVRLEGFESYLKTHPGATPQQYSSRSPVVG